MFSGHLAEGAEETLDRHPEMQGTWAAPLLNRVSAVCRGSADYFVRNMMDLYDVTQMFGIDVNSFFSATPVRPEPPPGHVVLSECWPVGRWVPLVSVAEELAPGLYGCTCWMCGTTKGTRGAASDEWYPMPGAGFLSFPDPLSARGADLGPVEELVGGRTAASMLRKDRNYAILPLAEPDGDIDPQQFADDMSWIDCGIDTLVRLLLALDIPDFGKRVVLPSEEDPLRDGAQAARPYILMETADGVLGDTPDDGTARRMAEDGHHEAMKDVQMDILPNLADFSDRLADGKL